MTPLQAALGYAKRGMYVFPCVENGKEPAVETGLLEATIDAAIIRRWWTDRPKLNVGLSCGPSGITAIDIDPRHGGDATFEGLRAELGAAAFDTASQATPSGGSHYLYRAPTEPPRNSAGKIGPGIDVRGAGGYILVPPSTTKEGAYVWELSSKVFADLPKALCDRLQEPRKARLEIADAIIEGGRNAQLTAIGGAMRRHGLSEAEIAAALSIVNRDRCKPPVPEAEIATIAKSMGRYQPTAPITAHRLPPSEFSDVQELTVAFEEDTATIGHLVEGLIPLGGSMVLGAKKKVGKSVLLVNLARSIVRGEPFLGRHCRKGAVLYGSFDEPKSVTMMRLEAIGLKGQPGFFLWARRGGLGENWPTIMRSYIDRFRPTLFIVDTLAKLANIREINSYGEWNQAYAPLHAAADEFGCAIVVTVHNKKEGGGIDAMAGSSGGVGGNPDTLMVIEKDLQKVRTIETEQRIGNDIERSILYMNEDTFQVSMGSEAWLQKQRELQQEILNALGTDSLTLEHILSKVKRRVIKTKEALYAAIDSGFILSGGRGIRGEPRLYRSAGKRDQETEIAISHKGESLVPKTAHVSGDQADHEIGWAVEVGGKPGPVIGTKMGPTGTNRDQETEEPDLLMLYAKERLGYP